MCCVELNTDATSCSSDQANAVVTTTGKKTHPLVNGSTSVADPPVTIRQEPISPVKVVYIMVSIVYAVLHMPCI